MYNSYNCPLSTLLIEQASNAFKFFHKGRCSTFSLMQCWTRLNSLSVFEALSLSSPDELQLLVILLLMNLLLMTASLQEHLYFRCTFLQMLQTSFLLIPLLSFVLLEPYKDIKFLSMVLYT